MRVLGGLNKGAIWEVGSGVHHCWMGTYEKDKQEAAYLLKHVSLNNRNNVTFVQAAVSEKVGVVSFAVGESSSVGAIIRNSNYQIPSVTLDYYFQNEAPDAVPDIIKIDVEGAEAAVLQGGAELLTRHNPEIWLALHNRQAMRDCTDLLKRFGYTIYSLRGEVKADIVEDEIVARKSVDLN